MHNFTLASPPIPNMKFLSFVVSEKCVILKICTFSIKKTMILQEKNQQINLNFELALNNSVIMLPTKHYADRPKTKNAIALTKIGQHTPAHPPAFHQNISRQQLRCNSINKALSNTSTHRHLFHSKNICPLLFLTSR